MPSTLREKIAAEKIERLARYDTFSTLIERAHEAGMNAGNGATPSPHMVHSLYRSYLLTDGACGFAWVNIRPGGSSFARWLVNTGKARRDGYLGGVTVWVPYFGQSMVRKEAYAVAYAQVLQEAGIVAHAGSRLD
jgi:hypothetical protein